MSNSLAIVQARMGSERCPGKSLAEIDGKPMVRHVLEAAAEALQDPYSVALAVPYEDHGDFRDVWRWVYAVPVPEEDVLSRIWHIGGDRTGSRGCIIRLTGDCPRIRPDHICAVESLITSGIADYAATGEQAGGEDGQDAEAFTRGLLKRAHEEATDPHDREHVTPAIRRLAQNPWYLVHGKHRDGKTSIDTPEELKAARGRHVGAV